MALLAARPPIFTREDIEMIERVLNEDEQWHTVRERPSGKLLRRYNRNQNVRQEYRPGSRRNRVEFSDERRIEYEESVNRQPWPHPSCRIVPCDIGDFAIPTINRSINQIYEMVSGLIEDYQRRTPSTLDPGDMTLDQMRAMMATPATPAIASPYSDYYLGLVRGLAQVVATRKVDKICCFGLGTPGAARDVGAYISSCQEHAAAHLIWNIVKTLQQDKDVRLIVQDFYSINCRVALNQLGFEPLENYGAAGFLQLDENSIYIVHYASFPARELVLDLARPALMCVSSKDWNDRSVDPKRRDMAADVNSPRYDAWLREFYRPANDIPLGPFRDNHWVVRK
ncbi:hypothetical protein F4778DRAFT_751140 [Xylariomycetidae sp. FL2044]|nr:hypothetical protein F4778DRAFT_751140 [Xylariomycetidae sp. FL2044]